MILLDTNVVSEVMRAEPAPKVMAWFGGQEAHRLFVSAITMGEIAYGLRILPEGHRRTELRHRFTRFITLAFASRVLAYDEAAAHCFGELMAERRVAGRPISVPDGQIAAIARRDGLAIATRNVNDFDRIGIEVIDPFRVGS
jgi:toxin FitB